jgi:hypothetical protein
MVFSPNDLFYFLHTPRTLSKRIFHDVSPLGRGLRGGLKSASKALLI